MYHATVIEDSVGTNGVPRLTTFEIEFPRIVLAEVVTHRMNNDTWECWWAERTTTKDISKNSASSRAIPFKRMVEMVQADPYVPERFSRNQSGMQEAGFLESTDHEVAVVVWLKALDQAILNAEMLHELGVHKQDVNRLLEPWAWVKQVVTATEWANFFTLRCDRAAHPAFRKVARMMYLAMQQSTPMPRRSGEWHLPYVSQAERSERSLEWQQRASVARCAWVSYWPPDGTQGSEEKIERTMSRLLDSRPRHGSPFEHQATPFPLGPEDPRLTSNLRHWLQLRKTIPGERTATYHPFEEEIASWEL